MLYHNTLHPDIKVSLKEAVMTGIGIDNGLYMPDFIPVLPRAVINNIPGMSIIEIGYLVAGTLFDKVIPLDIVHSLVRESLTFRAPIKELETGRYVLELFHGPTGTVKDGGARFLSRMFSYYTRSEHGTDGAMNIIVATSGDTGAAVANGFASISGVNVFVLFPDGKLTEGQLRLFSMDKSVHPVAVRGSFEDCRRIVRETLNSSEIHSHYHIATANSLNIARILAQTIMFFHGYARLAAETDLSGKKIVISVPSGNLGTLTAVLIAKRMGLPVNRYISAHNINNAFCRYLDTGVYKPSPDTVTTISPALDVNNPDNYSRVMDLYGNSLEHLRKDVTGVSFPDIVVSETISRIERLKGYFLDPHSALAYSALSGLADDEVGIALATASPDRYSPKSKKGITAIRGNAPVKIARTLSAFRRVLEQINNPN